MPSSNGIRRCQVEHGCEDLLNLVSNLSIFGPSASFEECGASIVAEGAKDLILIWHVSIDLPMARAVHSGVICDDYELLTALSCRSRASTEARAGHMKPARGKSLRNVTTGCWRSCSEAILVVKLVVTGVVESACLLSDIVVSGGGGLMKLEVEPNLLNSGRARELLLNTVPFYIRFLPLMLRYLNTLNSIGSWYARVIGKISSSQYHTEFSGN